MKIHLRCLRHFRHLRRSTRNRLMMVLVGVVAVALCGFGFVSAFEPVMTGLSRTKPTAAFSVAPVSTVSSRADSAASVPSPSSSSSPAFSSSSPASSPVSSGEESEPDDSAASSRPGRGPGLPSGKTVYLTFDDGPSSLTAPLLDVLDECQVKATFFVVGVNDANETHDLQEIARRGHAIGVHSWTHNYHQIYASPEAFFADFDRMHQAIFNATGIDTKICRFPGGSVNGYNTKTRRAILKGLKQRGYVYYDWNVSGSDTVEHISSDTIFSRALEGVHAHRVSVVLFHNTSAKAATLRQVPKFISTLKNEGYRFAVLSPSVDNSPFIF